MSELPKSWANFGIPEKVYQDTNMYIKRKLETILINQFGFDIELAIHTIDKWNVGNFTPQTNV